MKRTYQLLFFIFVILSMVAWLLWEGLATLKVFRPAAIVQIDKDQLQSLLIQNSHGMIEIQKEGEVFYLKQPLETKVQEERITTLLNGLKRLTEVTAASEDTHRYGFEKPTASLTLVESGQKKVLELGGQTIDGGAYFLRIQQHPFVYKCPFQVAAFFLGTYTNFRDDRIFAHDLSGPFELVVQTEDEKFSQEDPRALSWIQFLQEARFENIHSLDDRMAQSHHFGLLEPDILLQIRFPSSGETLTQPFSIFSGRCFTTLDSPDKIAELTLSSCEALQKTLLSLSLPQP